MKSWAPLRRNVITPVPLGDRAIPPRYAFCGEFAATGPEGCHPRSGDAAATGLATSRAANPVMSIASTSTPEIPLFIIHCLPRNAEATGSRRMKRPRNRGAGHIARGSTPTEGHRLRILWSGFCVSRLPSGLREREGPPHHGDDPAGHAHRLRPGRVGGHGDLDAARMVHFDSLFDGEPLLGGQRSVEREVRPARAGRAARGRVLRDALEREESPGGEVRVPLR